MIKNLLLLISLMSANCAFNDVDNTPEERKYLLVEFENVQPAAVVSAKSDIHRMSESKICGIRANIITTNSNSNKRFIVIRPKEGECDLEQYSQNLESMLLETSDSAIVSLVSKSEYGQIIRDESLR